MIRVLSFILAFVLCLQAQAQSTYMDRIGKVASVGATLRVAHDGTMRVEKDASIIYRGTQKETDIWLDQQLGVPGAYDPDRTVTWRLGHRNANTSAPSNYVQWGDVDGAVGDDDGASMLLLNPMANIQPGQKTISSARLKGAFFDNDYITGTFVEVWRLNGTNYERVAGSVDQGQLSEEVAGGKNWNVTLSTPITFTLESGYDYFYGVRFLRSDKNPGTPYIARTVDTDYTDGPVMAAIASSYDLTGGTIPAAGNGSTVIVTSTAKYLLGISLEYTSTAMLEFKVTSGNGTDGKYLVPWAESEPYYIKYEGIYVADTKDMTVTHGYIGLGTWANATINTTLVDMGKTVAGQNDLTYSTNLINLPDIGGNGQESCRMDLIWWQNLVTDKTDLFYQNTMRETSIHSHAVKNSGTRGTEYAQGQAVHHIDASGDNAASTTAIYVGVAPFVLIGDSQTISGNALQLRAPNTDRLGDLHNQATKPRGYILHGEAGGTMANQYANIFHATTPGDGDSVEMAGNGAIWIFCGMGVNDISTATLASDADVADTVAGLTDSLLAILRELLDAGETVWLIGLPPFSAASADQYDAKAVRAWNRALLGIAITHNLPFYNPWTDLVDSDTRHNAVPQFGSAYTADSGTHYNATGGKNRAVPAALKNFEFNRFDFREAWSY